MAYSEDVNINLNVLAGAMGGITAIMGGMSALTSTFGQFGTEAVNNFGAIDGLLVSSAALVASFGVQAAEAFGEFEQGMKIVQTVSGQAQYSVQQLGEQANQLSVHYRTAIGDITEGLQTLGRAGLNSAATQIEVLESGLQTAKLEGRNLNGVLEEIIQNTAMLGGDLKSIDFGKQSAYLNSLMVGTSMTAPINSHDISQTLQYAGGTAAAAGANLDNKEKLEDLMGTIAAFAQKGVTGSMSGTALRAFFTKPASQDKSVVEALGKLGLSPESLWEDGGNSMKKVSDQVGIIQRRMDALHLSTIDQVELWGKMVGPKMGQQMMKLDASSIKDLTRDIQSAQSAQELASKTLDTYNQKLSSLQQQGEVAFRGIGEKAVMFLSPLVDILNLITQAASHPVGNFAIWATMLGLIANGAKAAWGMITSLINQIRGLVTSIEGGMNALIHSSEGFGNGLSYSANQASILNAKLTETNATMQAIQARALGVNDMTWVANGGKPGEKVGRGVISSMSQDVFMGGKTDSGLAVGKEGKYYTAADKSKLREEALGISEKNKQAQESYATAQEKVTANTQKLRDKVSAINQDLIALNNKRSSFITRSQELTGIKTGFINLGEQSKYVGGVHRALSFTKGKLEEQINADAGIKARNSLLKEHNITEKDIAATNELITERKKLSAALRAEQKKYFANEESRLGRYVDKNHEKYSEGDKKYVKDRNAYITSSLYDPDKKDSSVNKFAAKHKEDFARLDEINKQLSSAKSQAIMTSSANISPEIVKAEEKVAAIKQLEQEIKIASEQNIDKLMLQLEESRMELLAQIRASEMAPTLTQAELEGLLPTATKTEINALMSQLSTEMHTQIRVMEEGIYQKEMQRLYAAGLKGDAAAALSYSQNKELEKAGVSKIDGTNSRQFVSNTLAPEKQSAIVTQAQKTLTNGVAKEMAIAQEEFRQRIQQSLYGSKKISGMGIRDKLQQNATNSMQTYSNALNSARQRLSDFTTQLTWSRKGFEALSASQKLSQYESVREAMAPLQQGAMYTEEALTVLMEKTNLSADQLGVLFQKSESLAIAFDNLKTKSMSTGKTSTREETQMILANASKKGGAASGALSRLGSAAKTVTGYMGGPFMAAMMGFSFASSLYQQSVSAWQKTMSDATNKMSEAKDKVSSAEDSIKELYSNENNTISEADLDKIIDYQYAAIQGSYNADMDKHGKKTDPKFAKMYNNEVVKVQDLNWSKEDKEKPLQDQLKTSEDLQALNDSTEKLSLTEEENVKKLEENTIALNSATYAFSQALNKEAMAFNDPTYGYQGSMTAIEEDTGLSGISALLAESPLAILTNELDIKDKIWEMFGWDKGFFEYNSGVLTQYQAGDNYPGSKEMGPLLSTDIYQLGIEGGLRQFFGSDFNSLKNSVDHINQKSGATLETFKALSNNNFQGMDSTGNAMAQMLWKEDPETIQKLGKQMFRYEQERGIDSGHSAMEDWHTGKLQHKKPGNDAAHPSADKSVYKDVAKKKYTVTDKNLKATMDKIYRMTDGKLSYANILAMGQLQMFSDMYTVANEQIYPTLSQQLIAANQNVLATGTAGTNAGAAANGAGAAANNAAVIAGMLGEKLKMEASGLEYENDYLQDPNAPKTGGILGFGEHLMSKEEFINEMSNLDNHDFDKYRENRWSSLAQVTGGLGHPEWGPEERKAYGERAMSKILNADGSLKDGVYKKLGIIDDTILGPGLKTLAKQIEASYDQSSVGEYGGGKNSGSGSGGGGGDGSGGSGSNSGNKGTQTNRVDLVLCNKKTIPKLNVNLFKKPPQFTIKNKQFSIRDINITTQDKPNAMVDAVKDSIIRTQQRMDPKIVQDEQAVYDPAAATDGTTTPKGKTAVKSK